MKRPLSSMALVCAAIGLAGCQGSALTGSAGRRLGPAREVVGACVESMGGLAAWNAVGRIHAEAVVSLYGVDGLGRLNRQRQEIDLRGGRIVAGAARPAGQWTAAVNDDAEGSFRSSAIDLDAAQEGQLRSALATLLHRVRGPLNLLWRAERARDARQTHLGGEDVVRVGVDGDNSKAIAYYFAADGGLLRFVASGADTPGREGSVTIYDYMMLANGMAFPKRIRVVEIGRHVMLGDRVILEAEFSNVRLD